MILLHINRSLKNKEDVHFRHYVAISSV